MAKDNVSLKSDMEVRTVVIYAPSVQRKCLVSRPLAMNSQTNADMRSQQCRNVGNPRTKYNSNQRLVLGGFLSNESLPSNAP